MALKTKKKMLAVEQVPEVARFVAVQDELYRFIKEHQQFIDEYAQLAEQFNDALEAADKSMRARCDEEMAGISCGPFEFKHFATKYDGDALLGALGNNEQDFQQLGGIIQTVRVNKVDPKMMESLIERGAVPEKLQREFVKRAANYDKPKKLAVTP
jgi:hypothetical protein